MNTASKQLARQRLRRLVAQIERDAALAPETVTAGLALFDYDGDGYIDIYFLNGAPMQGTKVDVPPRNSLYRNEGG